ncbi:MAG: hypothetical protein RLZZ458_605 [Planctomycetota bacterium]
MCESESDHETGVIRRADVDSAGLWVGFDLVLNNVAVFGGSCSGSSGFAGVFGGEQAGCGNFGESWVTEESEAVFPGDAHDFDGGV